jgi:hypothetical protein
MGFHVADPELVTASLEEVGLYEIRLGSRLEEVVDLIRTIDLDPARLGDVIVGLVGVLGGYDRREGKENDNREKGTAFHSSFSRRDHGREPRTGSGWLVRSVFEVKSTARQV